MSNAAEMQFHPSPAPIPFSQLKNVYALRGKNVGCSVQLRGRVVIIAFLINDSESRWDAASEKQFISLLNQTCLDLMDDSGLNRSELSLAYAHAPFSVSYRVDRHSSSRMIQDVMKHYGHRSVELYQEHYEEKFDLDDCCIAFVLNKDFRSYAANVVNSGGMATDPDPRGSEYSVVSFQSRQLTFSRKALIHELLHQFGAMDLYYPPVVREAAEKYLPNSIMNSGMVIDPLTRYVIGWNDMLPERAKEFLRATRHVTESDIHKAIAAEWRK